MGALQISPADQATSLVAVSLKYKIPLTALLGIYATETGGGTNVTTSSAGAVGPFQFMPSTAGQYSYPLTNTPTLTEFRQQADAWGRYLVANNPSRAASGWAPAMRGGYTEAQAEANISKIPSSVFNAVQHEAAVAKVSGGGVDLLNIAVSGLTGGISNLIPGGPSNVGNIAGGISAPFSTVADALSAIWGTLTNPKTWWRLLQGVLGLVLGYLAVKQLAAAGSRPVS